MIEDFFKKFPNIKHIFFNGEKAKKEFKKRVLPKMGEIKNKLKYHRLPSTSPAMTKMTFEQKKSKWLKIKDVI